MTTDIDTLFSTDLDQVPNFSFNESVADVFADMISRSVPGYTQILNLLPVLVKHVRTSITQDEQVYYDLGCSLGAGMLSIAKGLGDEEGSIIGIDNSCAMIEKARGLLDIGFADLRSKYELKLETLENIELKPNNLVLMNFTLQFIALKNRDALITQIYQSLNTGGALVLSEKIKHDDKHTDDYLIDVHHNFKAAQGYSQLEISQKRDAIENVLLPETLQQHTTRLKKAGFKIVTPWIQNLQFVSILAVK